MNSRAISLPRAWVTKKVMPENVQGVSSGEDLGTVFSYGDPVVRTHMMAEFLGVKVGLPGVYQVAGEHPARFHACERGEVGRDLVATNACNF